MGLITQLSWECFLLPGLLVVAWPLLWWRGSRRIRLWCAGLTPLGAVAGFFLGVLVASWGLAAPVPCAGGACDSGRDLGVSANSAAMSNLGMVIMVNSALALVVAVALGLLSLVVELVLLGVRAGGRTTPRQGASGTGPPALGPGDRRLRCR